MKGRPLGLNLAKRTIASFGFIKRGFSKDLREIYKCKKDQSESSLCKINEGLIKEMKMIPDPPGWAATILRAFSKVARICPRLREI